MSANPKQQGDLRPAVAFPPAGPAFLSGSDNAAPGASLGAALGAAPGAALPGVPFLGESQREAAVAIRNALAEGGVFAALTGEPGLGKTLLLDAVIARPGVPVRIFKLGNPSQVSAAQVAQIERALAQPAPGQRPTALFVDDAHAASGELLAFLARVAAGGRAGPQVVLAGRPELWDRLAGPDLAPLLERIALRPVLQPFTDADGRGLVRHILDQPRRSGQILSAEAEAEVLRFSAGWPERIGQILGGTLTLGDVQARPPIPAGVVRSAVAMLAGRRQPERRRRVGAWVAGVAILAAAGGGGLAVRDWPSVMHGWSPDRMMAALGLARPGVPGQAQVDASPAPRRLQPPASPPVQTSFTLVPAMPDPPAGADAPASASPPADALPQPVEASSSLVPPSVVPPSLASPGLISPDLTSPDLAPSSLMPSSLAPPSPLPAAQRPLMAGEAPAPLSPSTVAMLLRQGDGRLALGDISAARRLYERAASAGSAAGARGVARTYDPSMLGQAGMQADPAAFAAWQRRRAR